MTLAVETRRIDIGGRRLAVRVQGTGPVVVLEPGGGANSLPVAWNQLDWWNGVDEKLAQFCTVITYDRAGIGSSDPAEQFPQAEDRVRDLDALLDALKIDAPVLVAGHSFGGLIAQHFALAHPKRVAGVLLIDPTQSDSFSAMPIWIRWLPPLLFRAQTKWLRFKTTRSSGHDALKKGLRARWSDRLEPSIAEELLRIMTQPRGWDGILMETKRLAQSCARVQALIRMRGFPKVPLIVITSGFRGVSANPKGAEAIRRSHAATAAMMPEGELRVAEGISHIVLQEDPEGVLQAMRDLLARAKL